MKFKLLSAGAAQAMVARLAGAQGVEIEASFGAVGAMLEKYLAAGACDIVILARKQMDELAAQGRVDSATLVDLGAVPTSIAVCEREPSPDISDADALAVALLAADAIYFPDPAKATAGIHFRHVLERLGILDRVRARLRNFPNGAATMRAMAEAQGQPIGCTQATEIRATPGVRVVGPLPRGLDLVTVYAGAVDVRAENGDAARRFLASLAGQLS
ncbi:MAG TPA: substrate-binding domain-containing protein [Usitatibacter sp.]|nr:substrate-binding domain-containing protein [Usitatibacter sp.]